MPVIQKLSSSVQIKSGDNMCIRKALSIKILLCFMCYPQPCGVFYNLVLQIKDATPARATFFVWHLGDVHGFPEDDAHYRINGQANGDRVFLWETPPQHAAQLEPQRPNFIRRHSRRSDSASLA